MPMTTMIQPELDWDFRGCNTQYGTHGIHTYVAAMIPQLARQLIDLHAPPGGIVLDPFCGGGAVLVEAIDNGRAAIGRDVNQLAVLIAKAKTGKVDPNEALDVLSELTVEQPYLPPPEIDRQLAFWFKPEHLGALHSLGQAIDEIAPPEPIAILFKAVFSATVRDVSLTHRNEVRLRRMSQMEIDNFTVDPVERFYNRVRRAIEATSQLPDARVDVDLGTAQAIALGDDTCDTIVCSPPYGDERNGVNYTQFAKNMLGWLGYSTDEVRQAKGRTLGWGNGERTVPPSQTLEHSLEAVEAYPDSVKAAIAFYADYQAALAEMVRVTRGAIIIVIGPRVLRGTVFENGEITVDLMRGMGIPLKAAYYRQLPSKRLPKMRQFGAAIDRERILVFEK